MADRCQHIKADGQQCRGIAIWGSEPPRCTNHRLDGGPRPSHFEAGNQLGRLTLKHGYYSRRASDGLALEEKVARCLLTHGRLISLLKCAGSQRQVLRFFRLLGRNLDRLLRLMTEYEKTTGRHPDRLLAEAGGEPLTAELIKLQALRDEHKNNAKKRPRRAARYWLIYRTIVAHIREHRVSPTWRQLRKACGISSNNVLAYWLARLEEDGLIMRRPGQRGLYLPDEVERSPDY